jgi:ribosome-associated protein
MDLEIRPGLRLPEGELHWEFSRSSGPGGQHVNTSDTRVSLSFDVAGSAALGQALRERALRRLAGRLTDGRLVVTASEHRSQWLNRQAAADRLAVALRQAVAAPGPARRATRPSAAARERRLVDKRRRGQLKQNRRLPSE